MPADEEQALDLGHQAHRIWAEIVAEVVAEPFPGVRRGGIQWPMHPGLAAPADPEPGLLERIEMEAVDYRYRVRVPADVTLEFVIAEASLPDLTAAFADQLRGGMGIPREEIERWLDDRGLVLRTVPDVRVVSGKFQFLICQAHER